MFRMQRVIEQDILVHDKFSSSLNPAMTSTSLTLIPVAHPNPTTPPCTPMTHGNRLAQSSSVPSCHSSISFGYDAFSFGGAMSQPVTHYYHPNHRGDTAYLTDASGVTAASYVYDAFGRLLTDNGTPITNVYRGGPALTYNNLGTAQGQALNSAWRSGMREMRRAGVRCQCAAHHGV